MSKFFFFFFFNIHQESRLWGRQERTVSLVTFSTQFIFGSIDVMLLKSQCCSPVMVHTITLSIYSLNMDVISARVNTLHFNVSLIFTPRLSMQQANA